MPTPTVSVIIPTYHRPKAILRTIQSILAQTYQDYEIVIADDSRDEETKKSVGEIHDSRIRYFHNKERLGISENKNQAVRLTDPASRYVAYLDDDDEYLPEYLEKTVAFMNARPTCLAVCTDAETRRQDGSFVRRDRCEQKMFWRAGFGNGCLIRKDVFLKLNIWYDPSVLFEDLDFGVRIAENGGWDGIPEVLRVYNAYPGGPPKDATPHNTHSRVQPQENIERFLVKHHDAYAAAGPEALAWIFNMTGKVLVRNGYLEAGRGDLRRALRYEIRPTYLLDYAFAILFPGSFRSIGAMVWKNRVKGWFGK